LFLGISQLIAQEDEPDLKLRHIKGIKGLDLNYGFNKGGNYFGIGYVQFLTNVYTINPTIRYESGTIELTKYKEYTAILSFQRSIVNFKDRLYIFGGLGPCAQLLQTQNSILDKNETFTPFGISGEVNIEFFVFNRLSLKAELSEIYSFNDKFGTFRYFIAPGLRIYLN
jgi:hypothetical protein